MKIEAGKQYLTRDGRVATITKVVGDVAHGRYPTVSGGGSNGKGYYTKNWTTSGAAGSITTKLDLVARAPTALQRDTAPAGVTRHTAADGLQWVQIWVPSDALEAALRDKKPA